MTLEVLGSAELTLQAVAERLTARCADLRREWGDGPSPLGPDPVTLVERLLHGGKRLRPELAHWGWVASGGDPGRSDQLVDLGAALELLHAFALLHDDVMDRSQTRRGRPTGQVLVARAHRAGHGLGDPDHFGESVAVLAGDLALAEAQDLVSTLPGQVRREWRSMLVELVRGQHGDVAGAAAGGVDTDHAVAVARAKTGGYTVQRPLVMGALLAGVSEPRLTRLVRFGTAVGEAFALRDDLLGVWGDPARTGKPAGDDLLAGKPTVLRALAADRLADPTVLDRLPTGPAEVAELQGLLERHGVREQVESMVTDCVERALGALASADLTEPGRAGLGEIAARLAWREC